jgi:ATP-dependent Lhr-like helicase
VTTLPEQSAGALGGFTPFVRDWFLSRFACPSPAQVLAWPAIRRGESTLLLAPTGSGKTLAAFLCAIDELCRQGQSRSGLPAGVQVLYITPLKALGNDIHRNLLEPLAGIRARAGKAFPDIRVAVRTGDTPQAERQRQVRQPPHLLITTPESLFLLLGSGRMAPALRTVRTVIVDEVHALCDSKRGAHLAVSLERLEAQAAGPLQRVGCSATINPLEEVAAFLAGYGADGGPRPCTILDAGMRKDLDVRVLAPLPDFLAAGHDALWASAYELLVREIAAHRTTLVFCNSRHKAERTALRLTELAGDRLRIGVHHGSMSRDTRLEVETRLKAGELDALVCTSSLELGIDIGSVDLVVHLESAKSVASGLQRVGRAGHLLGATSKGRFLILERDELFEAGAICRAMREGRVDPIRIPRRCLDVLAQQLAGTVAASPRTDAELFALVRRSYPYADLPREQFDGVLRMLAGDRFFDLARPPRPLVLWDRASGRVSPARGAAMVAAMCVGTIPDTAEYDVFIEGIRKRVGRVHAEFVDDSLRTGDVFVLGSTAWKVAGKRRNQLLVTAAPGATPTVPWWLGPVIPRTDQVGRDCRARRSDRTELGYLADEPVFCLSSRDPANLYTYTLDVVEERGSVLRRSVKSGNVIHRLAVQAGQVPLFAETWGTQQLATLTRRQLERCLEALEQSCQATGLPVLMQSWNGHPIPDSPVAPVLWQRGYRFDGRRCLCWPPPRRPLPSLKPSVSAPHTFLPYYQEPAPCLYDEAWVVAHASAHIRPKLQELIDWLRDFMPDGCAFAFGPWGFAVPYRNKRCISPHIGKKRLRLQIQHKGWSPGMLITPDTDLTAPEFRQQVEARFALVCREIDERYGTDQCSVP